MNTVFELVFLCIRDTSVFHVATRGWANPTRTGTGTAHPNSTPLRVNTLQLQPLATLAFSVRRCSLGLLESDHER
jgi:hypothetical protein